MKEDNIYYQTTTSSSSSYFGSCIPDCLSCTDVENQCSKCVSGFYPNDVHWCCQCSTKSNCKTCSQTENKCLECNTDYYPSGTGCKKCDINQCSKCSTTAAICLTCNI